MNRLVTFVIGLSFGLLAGWVLFGSRSEPPRPSAELRAPPASSGVDAGSDSVGFDRAGAGAGRIVYRARPEQPTPPPQGALEPQQEMERLRFRLAELEKRLAADDALTRAKQGAPVKPPEHLDPRFGQEQVRMAVNAALKEVGLDGEATAVDCTEYPCLAVGEIKGSQFGRDASKRMMNAAAFQGYSDDSVQSMGNSIGENGHVRNLFGVAVYPKGTDEADRQQIAKRLRYRFDEIQGIE